MEGLRASIEGTSNGLLACMLKLTFKLKDRRLLKLIMDCAKQAKLLAKFKSISIRVDFKLDLNLIDSTQN